ncbi:MAG: hypothetical protein KGN77_06125 [Xanthomonadaceae bacterium]|nr:hypothetical protein [Xanthomonadaceae bacterium]MDE1964821.1 hypothetical protein [Xanthomonadaceae bacterium]
MKHGQRGILDLAYANGDIPDVPADLPRGIAWRRWPANATSPSTSASATLPSP